MADDHEWDDDEEEEEEEDFIPDADEDDDDAYEVEDEDGEDEGSIPTFLQGELFIDQSKGLCYEDQGGFCLVCQTSLDGSFDFRSPPVDKPLGFAGWIKNPSQWLEFVLVFSKEAEPKDELELKLLKMQEEKTGVNDDFKNDGSDAKKSSGKGNLKAPLSYSMESADGKTSAAQSKLKSPPSYSVTDDNISTASQGTVFVVSATHQGDDGGKLRRVSLRGVYRSPTTFISRLYLISTVQVEENSFDSTAEKKGASRSAGTHAPGPAGAAAAAAPARKRSRSDRDDDESVEGSGGVEYQELIDLHDDAGLSTEELRRRYYGGGIGDDDTKMPSADKSKRVKGSSKKNDEDDEDDDDAYGF
jgi:hypothetical protein